MPAAASPGVRPGTARLFYGWIVVAAGLLFALAGSMAAWGPLAAGSPRLTPPAALA
jgi:hypothetical protein